MGAEQGLASVNSFPRAAIGLIPWVSSVGDELNVPRLDRYVLAQCLVLFGFFALVFVSVYWVNRAVLLFDRLIGDGQSALVFLEFTALSLPNVIRIVLPIAAFAAAVALTNRLSNESELVVAQATGVSVWQLARPFVWFGLAVSLMMAALVHVLVPLARSELATREAEVAADVSSRILTEGRFVHPSPGITFYVREITPEGELLGVFLSDARSPDQDVTYLASRAFLVRDNGTAKLVMFDGTAETLNRETNRLFTTSFDDFAYDIGDLIVGGTRVGQDMRELSTIPLLVASETTQQLTRRSAQQLRLEGHDRIAQTLRPLVTALIGFAALMVGGFSRFGIWRQVVFAIILLILVQMVEGAAASAAAKTGQLWLIYSPVLLGVSISVILLWVSERPQLLRWPRRRAADTPNSGAAT